MTEWFRRKSQNIKTSTKRDTKEGMWVKCPDCGEVVYSNLLVIFFALPIKLPTILSFSLIDNPQPSLKMTLRTLFLGGLSAYLVSFYEFVGVNFFKYSLLMSFAIPPYIYAYTLSAFFENP